MRTRIAARPDLLRIGGAVLALAAVVVAILVLTGHKSALPGIASPPGTLADPVPYDGRSPGQPAQDDGRLNSRGARVRPVRRTYPASGEPVPVKAGRPAEKAAGAGQPPVAVL